MKRDDFITPKDMGIVNCTGVLKSEDAAVPMSAFALALLAYLESPEAQADAEEYDPYTWQGVTYIRPSIQ